VTEREQDKPEEMTDEELERANAEALPDRHALSVIRGVQPLPQPIVIEPTEPPVAS
jgi:hypothetical protein